MGALATMDPTRESVDGSAPADGGAGPEARTVSDDRELVARYLARRDPLAFRALYRRHTPYLYGMALRLSAGHDEMADELVEAAWVRALRGLAGFRWGSALRTWLAGIVLNCHREARRQAERDRTEELRMDPPARGAPPGLALELEEALAALPDGMREVFVLHHVYGYKHREIAASLGISEGTSKSQLARGVARLRELLS